MFGLQTHFPVLSQLLSTAPSPSQVHSVKKYEEFNEDLADLNNKNLEKKRVLITKQSQVLPYMVKKNLQPKLVQPDWIYNQQYQHINYNPKSKVGYRAQILSF